MGGQPTITMELRKWRRKGDSGVVGLSYNDTRNVFHDGQEFILLATYQPWLEDGENFYAQGMLRTYYKLPKAEEVRG